MPDTFTVPDEMPAAEPVDIGPAEPVDPEAPYGRLQNGKPRKTPPKPRTAPKAAAAPKAGAPRAPKKPAPTDFRPVIEQGVSLLSVALMGLGRSNRAFLADAATLQMNAPEVAHAVNEVAQINPAVRRMLTTTAPALPYVLLGSALFNMGVQIAANHGVALPLPGARVHDPSELADAMEAQMREAQRQGQEAQQRAAAQDGPKPGPPPSARPREHAFAGH